MHIADRIETLVPYLRRYARAATGDTAAGDACVERVLQLVLERALDSDFDPSRYDREGVFCLLDAELEDLATSPNAKARRAVLLIAVEGFPELAARRVLQVNDQEFRTLLEIGQNDFAESLATRMLIVEDEPLISAQIKRIAEGLGHKIIGVATRASEAVELCDAHTPDIVLCDIHLADGSMGTDAVRDMALPDNVPVVYVTAYPEKYLSTTNEGPSYLIAKPFDPDYLRAVIGHALLNVQGR
ncbi:MAG: response regulator [Pseudomonadota bacterium]